MSDHVFSFHNILDNVLLYYGSDFDGFVVRPAPPLLPGCIYPYKPYIQTRTPYKPQPYKPLNPKPTNPKAPTLALA